MAEFLDIQGLDEAQAKLEQVQRDLHGSPMLDAMRTAVLIVERDAKINAPVDTGRLRASITPEVREPFGETIQGVVGSIVDYAGYMELGTSPHWPPRAALEVWAERHGIPTFLVLRAIAMRGTPALHYLEDALEDNRDEIERILEQSVEGIVNT